MAFDDKMSSVTDRGLLRLTIPIFCEYLFLNITGFADTWIASLISDKAAVAASCTFILIMIASSMLGSLVQGGSIIMAQLLGGKRVFEFSRVAFVLLVCMGIAGVLVSAALLIFPRMFVSLLNLPEDLVGIACYYLRYVGGSMIFAEMAWCLGAIINVQGLTKYSMLSTIFANAIRLLLAYVLVTGISGLPQLGIAGLGIATVGSRILHMCLNLYLVRSLGTFSRCFIASLRTAIMDIRAILNVGLPTILEPMSYHGVQAIIITALGSFGSLHLAVRTYVVAIVGVLEAGMFAIGYALQITMGHFIGAEDADSLKRAVIRGVFMSLTFSLPLSIVVICFCQNLLGLFSADSEVRLLGSHVLVLAALLLPLKGINVLLGAILRAFGDTKYLAGSTVIVMWVIYLPLAYMFVSILQLGVVGVWVAFFVDEILRGLVLLRRCRMIKMTQWSKSKLIAVPA